MVTSQLTVFFFTVACAHDLFPITEVHYNPKNQRRQSLAPLRPAAIKTSVGLICQQGKQRQRFSFQLNTGGKTLKGALVHPSQTKSSN